MARQVLVTLVDDYDGGTADETVSFAVDGVGYEIDLSANNAGVLRDIFGDYIKVGRKVPSTAKGKRTTSVAARVSAGAAAANREQMSAARDWVKRNGWPDVKNRGRLPKEAMDAYQAHAGRSRVLQPA